MAINLTQKYPQQVDASTPEYPLGKARNVTSIDDNNATPLDEAWMNDHFGFQQALLAEVGIVPSGEPDRVGASDYLEAIKTLVTNNQPHMGSVSVRKWGAVGDGVTDDTESLNDAFNSGETIDISGGEWLYTQLVVDSALTLTGKGTLKYSGAAGTLGDATLIFNGPFKAPYLTVKTAGDQDLIYDIAHFNHDDVMIGMLKQLSDVQRNERGGCIFKKNNVIIGSSYSEKIGRPLAFSDSDNVGLWRKNVYIGKVVSDTYLRGLSCSFVDNVSVDSIHVKGMWQGLEKAPGYNGVIFGTCKNFHMGNVYIADSLEHGFRIGGLEGSENWSIGSLYTKDTLGCGFKIAPLAPERVKNGTIGNLTVVNAGRGLIAGNQEAIRLSSVDGLVIGNASTLMFATSSMTLADVSNLQIGRLYGQNVVERILAFNELLDSTMGSCENIHIDNIVGNCQNATSTTAISAKYTTPGRTIKGLYIGDANVTGFSGAAVNFDSANISESFVGVTVPSINDLATIANVISDTVFCRVTKLGETYTGIAKNVEVYGNTAAGGQLKLTDAASRPATFLSSVNLTSAPGNYGTWQGFSRLGSTRRGGALALKQTGASSSRNGLAFFVQSTSTPADTALREGMVIKDTGVINAPLLPTSATGLVAGDIWNDAGTLKIV